MLCRGGQELVIRSCFYQALLEEEDLLQLLPCCCCSQDRMWCALLLLTLNTLCGISILSFSWPAKKAPLLCTGLPRAVRGWCCSLNKLHHLIAALLSHKLTQLLHQPVLHRV